MTGNENAYRRPCLGRAFFCIAVAALSLGCMDQFTTGQSQRGGGGGTGSPDQGGGAAGSSAEPSVPQNGLLLWLSADDVDAGEDELVQSWKDRSSNHADASSEDAEQAPKLVSHAISEHAAVQFDGENDVLDLPSGFADFAAGVSIFAIAKQEQSESCSAIVELSNGSEVDDISFGQYQGELIYEVSEGNLTGGTIDSGNPQLLYAVHSEDGAVDLHPQAEGEASIELPSDVERQQCYLGRSLYAECGPFKGAIGELLIYDRAVSDDEKASIVETLRTTWDCCQQ